MKTIYTAALAFIAGLSIAATTQPHAAPGRYQLAAGSYNVVSQGAGRVTPLTGLYRLDTATGEIEEVVGYEEVGHIRRQANPFLKAP